ncbi:hypothetical protein [Pseudonocardia sp. C8]|uniref:hypothetical protein n=1 Tax=Pseudonocardia sp. C8 TaxID=2762759 RepID=UPI001C92BFAD|nr:hypothetical protein [Pseudonocardia sp. C8]
MDLTTVAGAAHAAMDDPLTWLHHAATSAAHDLDRPPTPRHHDPIDLHDLDVEADATA